MKELVTQAASNTLGAGERTAIKSELTELTSEIGDIVSETQFNSVALIDGTYTGKSFQTGEGTADTLTFSISQSHTAAAITVAAAAVATISRLTVKENTLSIAITNTLATRGRILDADIAKEQLESTRLQILQQTATAQLAQANVIPQNDLALFT